MKYLGIDYGLKRIGVASSEGILAKPVCVIQNKGDKKNLAAIHNILGTSSNEPPQIVLGVPLGANGEDTQMSLEIRRFGDFLSAELGTSVIYHNERYSSLEAEHYIRTRKTKELVDAVAAAVILQSYIDGGKNG